MANQKKSNGGLIALICVLAVVLVALIIVAATMGGGSGSVTPTQTDPVITTEPTTEPTTEETTEPTTEPPIEKIATATVGAVGDILMHDALIQGGYDRTTDTYNYDYIFRWLGPALEQVDFAAANLEVTLGGNENRKYSGYPCFNCPDTIVDALKNANFDLLLTANNHSYDTGAHGFARTQQVLADKGMPHIGSRPTEDAKSYYIADINGIKVGMVNYTYNTNAYQDGSVALNGIKLSKENTALINTFNYNKLDAFYAQLTQQLEDMKADGAEATVIYIHWGDEYQIKENGHQNKIAQGLCDLGVDVIVGTHAHVPQPVELQTSKNDENQKTLCLYSTGNSVSNIYQTSKFPVNTEDGIFFTFTFAKYSDGTVLVESARVIPTWVHRSYEVNKWKHVVMVMDDTVEDWKTAMELDDTVLTYCQNSYNRTMKIVSEGLDQANEYYKANQEKVEAELGVQ